MSSRATLLLLALLLSAVATAAQIIEHDARLRALIDPHAEIERIADGFGWLEGPVWSSEGRFLLFSDIPANRIYRWSPTSMVSVFLERSGYSGPAPFTGAEPGSNGLNFDSEGRLVICEHGDRRISRIEHDGRRVVLVDRFAGRRLNSPNDAVFDSAGNLYFTDPPFGLPGNFADPGKELDYSGVYRLRPSGRVDLLYRDARAPNGIGLSPDERTLYITDVDPERSAWLAFDIRHDGQLGPVQVIRDATRESGSGRGAPDGLDVDVHGHLFAAGPGGVFVMTADGDLLGKIELGVPTANVAWGNDGSTLYIAASTAIYRINTRTRGVHLGFTSTGEST